MFFLAATFGWMNRRRFGLQKGGSQEHISQGSVLSREYSPSSIYLIRIYTEVLFTLSTMLVGLLILIFIR